MQATAPAALAFVAVLVACQGPVAAPPASIPNAAQTRANPGYQVCGETNFRALDKQGGVEKLPHIPQQKQFMGSFEYATIDAPGRVEGLAFSCPTSDPITPIPQGYTPDWFGSWTLSCKKVSACNGLSFGAASLTGSLASKAWLMTRTYYLYLYTLDTRQFIESYQIGPVVNGTHGNFNLMFTSPFENALQYPTNEGYGLEIVHPAGS